MPSDAPRYSIFEDGFAAGLTANLPSDLPQSLNFSASLRPAACTPSDFGAFRWPDRMNPRLTFDEVVAAREELLDRRSASGSVTPPPCCRGPIFAPLALRDIAAIVLRFRPSNDWVRRKYGVRVSGVSRATLLREIVILLDADRDGREQRRLIPRLGRPRR
jgi:hypothetical protein